jgi:hypothetical protein
MPSELVRELTGARLLNAKKVSKHVFSWLLPEDFPPARGEELDDSEIERLIACAKLGEAQRIALWSYIYCVSRLEVEADVRERAETLLEQLLIRPSHEKATRRKMDAALKRLSPVPTAAALLENPPQKLMSAITRMGVECARDSPTERRILHNLCANEFQHPRDRDAIKFIRNLPPDVVSKANDIVKRGVEINVMSSGLLINKESLPWLHQRYEETCEVLDVRDPPPLYLLSGGLRAYTVGIEVPMIVVESMAASLLDAREMIFLLGRELGHVMAGHSKGRSLCEVVFSMTGVASEMTLGLSRLVDTGLSLKLYSWLRYAEFTADRAGYLACQNLEAALRVMLKFSGFPARHYNEMHTRSLVEQAQMLQHRLDNSAMDKMFSILGTVGSESNSTIVRTKQLTDWIGDGHADLIIRQRA